MKKYATVFFFIVLGACVSAASAQTDCKVLVRELQGEYTGKCKKGLANGKGTAKGINTYEGSFKDGLPDGKGKYTWSTGEVYTGEWEAGSRNGIGTYWYTENGQRLSEEGLWINDEYMGPAPKPPKVINSVAVFNNSISKEGDGSAIRINIYLGGMDNTDLENFTLAGSSGQQYTAGSGVGFQNVTFPFKAKVSYNTWNQMHTSRYFSSFEFEINDPGIWHVKIYNK